MCDTCHLREELFYLINLPDWYGTHVESSVDRANALNIQALITDDKLTSHRTHTCNICSKSLFETSCCHFVF